MAERREFLLARQDRLRQAVVCEPRGHDAIVGALLTPPVEPGSAAGVVFFNNAGALGMCGHGLIGVVRTLEHLGRLAPGPVADRHAGRHGRRRARAGRRGHDRERAGLLPRARRRGGGAGPGPRHRRRRLGRELVLPDRAAEPPLDLAHVAALTDATSRILAALRAQGITGRDGGEIDHVELFGPPRRADADSRNFVLCPGLRLRPLALRHRHVGQDGRPRGARASSPRAERWRQESLTGSLFEGWLEERDGALVPRVRGRAFVTGRATLFFDPRDPFREGFTAA